MITFDSDVQTNPKYGKSPEDRTLEERLKRGFMILDKTNGPTSHQVTAWAREMLGLDKLGHGGTLDPFATGVLLLLSGKAMKLAPTVLGHDKTYVAVVKFQEEMDESVLREALSHFSGTIYNVPPEISAVKVQVRTRNIHAIELLESDRHLALIHVECESGTYIRTLVNDLSLWLNVPAKLVELRRPKSGRYQLNHSISMQQLADAHWRWKELGDASVLESLIYPIEWLVKDLPKLVIKDSAVAAVSRGAPLMRPGLVSMDDEAKQNHDVAIMSMKDELVAIGKLIVSPSDLPSMISGEVSIPKQVFIDEDTYPKGWVR